MYVCMDGCMYTNYMQNFAYIYIYIYLHTNHVNIYMLIH